jgi:F0F1-type ATP synthase membrane subunit b/b'
LTKKLIIQDAKIEAEKIKNKNILNTKVIIAREKEIAIKDLKNYVVKFSLNITEKLLRKELKLDKSQKDLINNLLKNF